MKHKRKEFFYVRSTLCGVLLAGIIVAPTLNAAESQSQIWEQRYMVKPPPPAVTKPANNAPVVTTPKSIKQAQGTPKPAAAGKPKHVEASAAPAPAQTQPGLSFSEAINQALITSPQFKATQLDVEISKLGEKDAWYKMLPKLNMVASYDTPLNSNQNGEKANSYTNLSFSTGSYDPIAAYIGHDASKVATKLAEMMHIQAIQVFIEKVGISYIKLNFQEKTIQCRKELRELSRKNQEFAAERTAKGSLSPLDQRLADLKGSVAQMELEYDKNIRTQETIHLKRLLGIAPEFNTNFATASLNDVIGDQPTMTLPKFTDVERRNIEFKIMRLKEKLQIYNVRLAQAEHLPKFSLGLRTPDPTATKNSSSPYYATFSATLPIWSWGETVRGVERAELKGQRISAENALQTDVARELWATTGLDLAQLQQRATIATATRELRAMEAKRKVISYQAGNAPHDALFEAQITAIQAKLAELKAQEDYAMARLKLRVQSGELLNQLVKVPNGPME